ncbi:GNAT family N-acetyltransferase [Acidisoma sp. 7E03]
MTLPLLPEGYVISTDPERLDLAAIHRYLAGESYWARGISRDLVARSLQHSLCFGLYHHGAQAGLARVVTDRATFALLADVFVLETHRGQGLSKRLVERVTAHPDLQGLRRWILVTSDAHGLYAQYGFTPLAEPGRFMEIARPNIHLEG